MAEDDSGLENWVTRDRGGLSHDDRRWYLSLDRPENDDRKSPKEISDSEDAVYHRKRRIRHRIRNAIIDFELLADVNNDNIHRVFDGVLEGYHQDLPHIPIHQMVDGDPELANGLHSLFELLYLCIGTDESGQGSLFHSLLEESVARAFQRMHAQNGYSVLSPDVELTIDAGERVRIGKLKSRYEDGVFLFREELKQLSMHGEISAEEARERISEQQDLSELESADEVEDYAVKRDKRRREQRRKAAEEVSDDEDAPE